MVERSFALAGAELQFALPAAAHARHHAVAWRGALAACADISIGGLTRWSETYGVALRLDRVYCWLRTDIDACTLGDPLVRSRRGPSDHVLVVFCFGCPPSAGVGGAADTAVDLQAAVVRDRV